MQAWRQGQRRRRAARGCLRRAAPAPLVSEAQQQARCRAAGSRALTCLLAAVELRVLGAGDVPAGRAGSPHGTRPPPRAPRPPPSPAAPLTSCPSGAAASPWLRLGPEAPTAAGTRTAEAAAPFRGGCGAEGPRRETRAASGVPGPALRRRRSGRASGGGRGEPRGGRGPCRGPSGKRRHPLGNAGPRARLKARG